MREPITVSIYNIIVQNKLRTKSPFILCYYKMTSLRYHFIFVFMFRTVSVTVATDRQKATEQKPPFLYYMLWELATREPTTVSIYNIIVQNKLRTKSPFNLCYYKMTSLTYHFIFVFIFRNVSVTANGSSKATEQKPPFLYNMLLELAKRTEVVFVSFLTQHHLRTLPCAKNR
jgi:hypothetical protein